MDYNNLIKMKVSDYVHVSIAHEIKNDLKPRTTGAIALYPTENTQGSWYFLESIRDKSNNKELLFEWDPDNKITDDPAQDNEDLERIFPNNVGKDDESDAGLGDDADDGVRSNDTPDQFPE